MFAVISHARQTLCVVLPRRGPHVLENRPISELNEFLTCRRRAEPLGLRSFASINQTTIPFARKSLQTEKLFGELISGDRSRSRSFEKFISDAITERFCTLPAP